MNTILSANPTTIERVLALPDELAHTIFTLAISKQASERAHNFIDKKKFCIDCGDLRTDEYPPKNSIAAKHQEVYQCLPCSKYHKFCTVCQLNLYSMLDIFSIINYDCCDFCVYYFTEMVDNPHQYEGYDYEPTDEEIRQTYYYEQEDYFDY